MELLLDAVSKINSTLSDYLLTFLLAGAGIYFTCRTRCVQLRCFKEGLNNAFGSFSLKGKKLAGGISPFQALTAAMAAQIGTGNIVGASGAVLAGGPGAIFWMWIIAFFGMATSYAEAVLAQRCRCFDEFGHAHGGPVFYIKRAFPNLFGTALSVFFAAACMISLGFMGNMVQANSIGETCSAAFGLPGWMVGIFISIGVMLIFVGGVSGLAKVTEKIVPLMAFLYLIGGLTVLIMRIEYIPDTFGLIFKYAFAPDALIGGTFGAALKMAVSQGVKRGLFSNEAGMGSTPHAHAAADAPSPHAQGTAAMISVFIDTGIVLTMTALIVISTIYAGDGPLAGANGSNYTELLAASGLTKTNLVQYAVASVSSNTVGNIFVAVCLLFFAYSTILSWHYFGKINFEYLFGQKFSIIYSVLVTVTVFIGTILKNELVWELQDMFSQLMVLPNIIALIALSTVVAQNSRR